MPVADSHCHVSPIWYEPVESLLYQMDANEVAHAVLVQMQGQTDNSYQFECVRRYPGRFASVAVVDTESLDAPAELGRLAGEGASGVRLRPTVRSPGVDPLGIWRAAERLDLSVSCIGSDKEFASPEFAALVAALPGLRIVIEHLGSEGPVGAGPADRTRSAFELARFPNTYMKIPGLGEFSPRAMPPTSPFPFEQTVPPLLTAAVAAFGPNRLMWGSDYPPVSFREGYRNALRFPMQELESLSAPDRELIFGGVALRVFPIRG